MKTLFLSLFAACGLCLCGCCCSKDKACGSDASCSKDKAACCSDKDAGSCCSAPAGDAKVEAAPKK